MGKDYEQPRWFPIELLAFKVVERSANLEPFWNRYEDIFSLFDHRLPRPCSVLPSCRIALSDFRIELPRLILPAVRYASKKTMGVEIAHTWRQSVRWGLTALDTSSGPLAHCQRG